MSKIYITIFAISFFEIPKFFHNFVANVNKIPNQMPWLTEVKSVTEK